VEDEAVTDVEVVARAKALQRADRTALPPMPRMMSTVQISSGLLCSTRTTSPTERPGAEIALQIASGNRRVVKLKSWTTMRSSKKWDPER
jgi:hypothetical protein